MATPATFTTYVRYRTKTNSTTLPDVEILSYMAFRQDELAQDILKVDEDILLIPQTTSLVADQREYLFPSDFLARMKRIEAKLDGTNWIKLFEMDLSGHDKPTNETNITLHFSNEEGHAFYDNLRKALYIYSGTITSVTDGLKLWVNTWPTPITDLSSSTDMSV